MSLVRRLRTLRGGTGVVSEARDRRLWTTLRTGAGVVVNCPGAVLLLRWGRGTVVNGSQTLRSPTTSSIGALGSRGGESGC